LISDIDEWDGENEGSNILLIEDNLTTQSGLPTPLIKDAEIIHQKKPLTI
jgi:hypothetical protein